MKEKYGSYSVNTVKSIYEIAKTVTDEYDLYDKIEQKYGFEGCKIAKVAYDAYKYDGYVPDFEVKTFYRIGEPRLNEIGTAYRNSHNFADDRQESGISVISKGWLHSLKSVFFGISDDKIKNRGIWAIKGFIIGYGGDDEPLIYATDWAVRTDYTSVCDIEGLVD